ncbi:ATP-dependent helicase [Patescibacteria group bacterium]|nr:ATP-dependent helicase [Patescibacteria group bacterium]MBU1123119.1 ATP-dependent helicase [Patescibacteria group bacterium]MBU1911328.1 ATP-dependent helicase [Patescibacteria group bacterium]
MTPSHTKAQAKATAPKKRIETLKMFDALYGRLNESQKQAVDNIEGSVIVVAGPGTGKTHVVATRTANILKKTQMRPSNILCLTFSVSAATEMRERLRLLIGPDAYGITIKNFHSFCNDLIQENPLVFDSWSAMEHISEVERTREVNKILDQLLPDLVLVNKKNPYTRTRQIIGKISQLKREGKTDKKELEDIVSEYEVQMAGKSKEGTKAYEKNLLQAQKFREFIKVFMMYQEMLEKTQRYDFEDMILYVIKALEEEDWLLASLQERFQYLLVDEFQDTNGSQYRLIELLTSYQNLDHEPNLFVVGDDDQAIYRFQGANLQNILSFHERFLNAPVITLTESYRCSQPILDSAGSLIKNNTERLVGKIEGLNKDLTSPNKSEGIEPVLLFSPSDATEPWLIADLVEERVKKGMKYDDIAILVQTNKELEPISDVLNARGIPVKLTGKKDLLAEPLVLQAIAILKALENPKSSALLAGALGCECFECHPADLAEIFRARIENEISLYNLLLSLDQEGSTLNIREKDKLINARDVIFNLHNKLLSRTVVDTLEHLLKESGLLAFAKGDVDGSEFDPIEFAALQDFFDRLKARAYEQIDFSFSSFLDDLKYYESSDYKDLRLSYSIPHLTEVGVQLMTAHQSKGMEFRVVIIPNFREGHWDKRRNPSSVSIPEDLLFGWEKTQKAFEKNQDERRIAFVAMTRAKEEVIFTCPKELTTGDKTREVSPSSFFAQSGDLKEVICDISNPESASLLLHDTVRDLDSEMKAFLKERLENFSLSVTALNHYLADPQMFLEVDLLRVPQANKAEFSYGNAVHDALKNWGFSVQQGKVLSKDEFVESFRKHLNEKELLTENEKARLIKAGEESLPRYYEQRLSGDTPFIHKVEYPVHTHFGSIPIKGAIDRIDLLAPESSVATIIDYKTGKPKSENQIRTEGDYFRQLAFYALLFECRNTPLDPQSFVLEFIGDGVDHPVTRSFVITQSDLDDLKKVVEEVWGRIVGLDFTKA